EVYAFVVAQQFLAGVVRQALGVDRFDVVRRGEAGDEHAIDPDGDQVGDVRVDEGDVANFAIELFPGDTAVAEAGPAAFAQELAVVPTVVGLQDAVVLDEGVEPVTARQAEPAGDDAATADDVLSLALGGVDGAE